ncbi:S8 family serine peptidase [Catellatospora chokoriensis]|uniref:Peptidase S8/S53 domain-containing protein n=1 Tax=Catellatospora chokoriensis TaxID=310353 RepID=A0A8J3K0W5_9ACTN|nr:S8 family serine peptidase [Catellatospora chokoriensis]GIF90427.1 hypothetical protein Cch02nite_38710 [Catellatospora chokoriensis]
MPGHAQPVRPGPVLTRFVHDRLADVEEHGPDRHDSDLPIRPLEPTATDIPVANGGVAAATPACGPTFAVGCAELSPISIYYSSRVQAQQAAQDAPRKNVVIVAGVGNLPRNRTLGYPAANPGVLAVGGVDRNGAHSPTSVTGDQVAIAAPCDDISTAFKQHQRGIGTGTSHATALVAGAAALLRTKFPQLPATEIVRRLTATAADKDPAGRGNQYGNGELDIVAALSTDIAPTAAATTAGPPARAPRRPRSPFHPLQRDQRRVSIPIPASELGTATPANRTKRALPALLTLSIAQHQPRRLRSDVGPHQGPGVPASCP